MASKVAGSEQKPRPVHDRFLYFGVALWNLDGS